MALDLGTSARRYPESAVLWAELRKLEADQVKSLQNLCRPGHCKISDVLNCNSEGSEQSECTSLDFVKSDLCACEDEGQVVLCGETGAMYWVMIFLKSKEIMIYWRQLCRLY